eukprot:Gb_35994 [translate_table: standard]
MVTVSRGRLMGISALIRLVLIVYGEWQDAHMEVHYTDVDYLVFSDAASLMASQRSPYDRATYRYSPLLALILMPNSFLHHCWGKLLFSAADLLVGHLIYYALKLRGVPEKQCTFCMAAWLFNPFTFTVATRGNCEPVVCAMILWILICLMRGRVVEAAVWYGLVVHLRIYPIIYVLPILIVLDSQYFESYQSPSLSSWNTKQSRQSSAEALFFMVVKDRFKVNLGQVLKKLLSKQRILFGLISGAVFFILTSIFYYLYGQKFLNEALLYHLTRTDPRHNFSIYFYHIYLHHEHDFTLAERLMSFLPQFMVQLVLVLFFAHDLPLCLFAQTVAFVAFNKVITAQYFVWFFCLLPLILPWTKLHLRWKGLLCIGLWAGAQIHWLGWAYLLEFKGKNVFIPLWLASIVFLAATTCVLGIILVNHNFCPLFQDKVTITDIRDGKKSD